MRDGAVGPSNGAKPYVWFGRADPTLHDQEVGSLCSRLVRELHPVLSHMAHSDMERPHEPVVVLFTRVAQDALRAHLISTWTSRIPKPTASAPAGPNPAQPSVLSNTERSRLKQLRRVVEETRDRINPRFLLVVSVNQPWTWTCVFLRSYQRLQPALHRLCPAAAQVVAERKLLPAPSLLPLHDLTPGADVLQRLRARTANTLRPLLQWMADEDMESSSERVPVLYVATDVHELAERFVSQLLAESGPRAAVPEPFTASGEASGRGDGRGAGAREAVGEGAAEGLVRRGVSLAELADGELQRVLLARDRLYEVLEALQPRVLLLVNWLSPGQMVAVLYRDYERLLTGIGEAMPHLTVYVWAPRALPKVADTSVYDFCYSNTCPARGTMQEGVRFCGRCMVAKYCSRECQAAHWVAGHCRVCQRLVDAKVEGLFARGLLDVRSSVASTREDK